MTQKTCVCGKASYCKSTVNEFYAVSPALVVSYQKKSCFCRWQSRAVRDQLHAAYTNDISVLELAERQTTELIFNPSRNVLR